MDCAWVPRVVAARPQVVGGATHHGATGLDFVYDDLEGDDAALDSTQPSRGRGGAKPVERESEQFFVKLSEFTEMLKKWLDGGHGAISGRGSIAAAHPPVQPEIANKLQEWFAAGLKDWDIAVEQPCNTYRECLSFKRRTDLPLSLDEILDSPEMLLQAIADDAIDVANIKLGKVGGLTKARRMRDICATAGIAVSVQETCGSDIAFAAICHLAQSTPDNVRRHIWDCRELAGTKTAEGAPAAKAGHARATDAPGLGIEPLVEVLGEPVAVYT